MAAVHSTKSTRVAVVTGAGSGIGRVAVDLLLSEGWTIAALEASAEAVRALQSAYPDNPELMTALADVTDEPLIEKLLDQVVARFGTINGVVNSAGIAADRPALDTPVDLFRRILDVNVVGSFIVARAAARHMVAAGNGGSIVNIGSVSGLRGSKGRVAYGASKGAVVTMTQVLANDLAPHGIRVNAIAPGPIDTPMVQKIHTDADRSLWKRFVPANRYGTPQDIAHAVSFLLDDRRAGFVTAVILPVDGGFAGAGIIAGRD
mgnify:CR=1 FL=1